MNARVSRPVTTLALVVLLLAVAFGIGYAYPDLVREWRARLAPQTQPVAREVSGTVDYPYALKSAVLAEAMESIASNERVRSLSAERASGAEISHALAEAIDAEITRQESRAAELAESRKRLIGERKTGRAADLLWLEEAHTRVAEDLFDAARRLRQKGSTSASDGTLQAILDVSRELPDPRSRELRRFAGISGDESLRLTPDETVARVITLEAERLLAARRLDDADAERLAPMLRSRLTAALKEKAAMGRVAWDLNREDLTEQVIAKGGRGIGTGGDAVVYATAAVNGYRLASGATDMTITISGARATGQFGGRYVPEGRLGSASVRGRFTGRLDGDTLTCTGTYKLTELDQSSGIGLVEEGTLSLIGLRVTNDEYVGSITLSPRSPVGPDRTIVWSSDI